MRELCAKLDRPDLKVQLIKSCQFVDWNTRLSVSKASKPKNEEEKKQAESINNDFS